MSAGRVLGTMRVWVRHPVSDGATAINPIANACLILIGTNFKYIRLDRGIRIRPPGKSWNVSLYAFDVARFKDASRSLLQKGDILVAFASCHS